MKRLLSALLLISLLAVLVSCGNTPATGITPPEGMKTAASEEGYTLFVPADWTVDLSTGIPMAYVSAVDTSNVTLVRVRDARTPADYFAAYAATLADTLTDYQEVAANDATTLGGRAAVTRTYKGTVLGVKYTFKQYLASVDGYIYTLTYTARDEIPSGSVTYFERYEETVDKIATALLFTGEATPEGEGVPPVLNEDGMKLASDPAISRYSLWVPAQYEVVLQNGTTSAICDRASVTLSYEIPTGHNINEYWEEKSAAYATLLADYDVVEDECSLPAATLEEVTVWLGDRQAAKYVFTYTAGGETYKSVKLMTIEGVYVYTLTYTAPYTAGGTSPFDTHYAELEAIAAAFSFK